MAAILPHSNGHVLCFVPMPHGSPLAAQKTSLWPMSVAIRGLTAQSAAEMVSSVHMVARLDGGTNLVHESVNPDRPTVFTRHW